MDNRIETEVVSLKRLIGIDQLRYVLALWVFFTHGGEPPFWEGHADTVFLNFVDRLYSWCINGQAAVIGFFIISGLCIHYPNISRGKLDLKSFYAARFLRLSLPLIICLVIAKLIGFYHDAGFMRVVPIWTLYCEAMYYLLYPLILIIVRKGKLIEAIIISSAISFFLLIFWYDQRPMYFHEFIDGEVNAWRAAVLALPVWLLGVLIAERISNKEVIKAFQSKNINIWNWRIGALLLSFVSFPLYRVGLYLDILKSPILGLIFTSQFTLLLYSFYAFLWIEKEVMINNFGKQSLSPFLEKLGLASYSLYLIHTLVLWGFHSIIQLYFPGYLFSWILLVVVTHCVMMLFYKFVEKPSHYISKWSAGVLRSN